jgi:hypothetical protein
MLAQPRPDRRPVSPSEDTLFAALENVLAQYQVWKKSRQAIQTQIVFDFQSPFLPSQDQVCDLLQHVDLFALALRRVADQLEREVAETTDQFYEWLYD